MDKSDISRLPIVVDLDETLILTDSLVEIMVGAALKNPVAFLFALFSILSGRVAFKRAMQAAHDPDFDTMPVRADLVEYLKEKKTAGHEIGLATASLQSIAERVAGRFGDLFSFVHGTQGDANLKGKNKAKRLETLYPDGFLYAGDSKADLDVWTASKGAILVGVSSSVRASIRQSKIPIEADFRNQSSHLRSWRKALRIHQWTKNVLIFVPLVLSGQFVDLENWLFPIIGFFTLSFTASGTYIINDLSDLSADRRHRTKRSRPFAAGSLNPLVGLVVAAALILSSIVTGAMLNAMFGLGLVTYLVITMAYSFGLKQVAMLDVFVIASLFTIRIILGALAIGSTMSEWLLTFSMFFFLSLSFAKRHVEVAAAGAGETLHGRGYSGDDAPLTLVFGVAAGTAAILILVLYLVEDAFPSGLYAIPEMMWSAPMLIMLWMMRIWTLAHRGELDDDPVAFAVRDRVSLWMGIGLMAAFLIAILPRAL